MNTLAMLGGPALVAVAFGTTYQKEIINFFGRKLRKLQATLMTLGKKGRMLFKTFSKRAQRKRLQKILAFRALKNSRDSKQAPQPEQEVLPNTSTIAKTLGERECSFMVIV